MYQAMPVPESLWPTSIAGWIGVFVVVAGVIRQLVKWIKNWGLDTDKWSRAAVALEKLSKDVGELLFEIRGVNGKGGINERLETLEDDVKEIQSRNSDADAFLDFYKSELRERRQRGEPTRRDLDALLSKINPEPAT